MLYIYLKCKNAFGSEEDGFKFCCFRHGKARWSDYPNHKSKFLGHLISDDSEKKCYTVIDQKTEVWSGVRG